MKSSIIAIGTAHPKHREPQDHAVEFMSKALELSPAQKRLYRSLYKATGTKHRYTVLEDFTKAHGELSFFPNDPSEDFPCTAKRMSAYREHALPLALEAIENCLSSMTGFEENPRSLAETTTTSRFVGDAERRTGVCSFAHEDSSTASTTKAAVVGEFCKRSITHLITVSCTGMYAPGLDIDIALSLNLPTDVHRTGINFMGCYGVFNGLKVADAICQSNPNATVLLVSVELCTLHFQKSSELHNLISSAIFADGAGAVIVKHVGWTKRSVSTIDSVDASHSLLCPPYIKKSLQILDFHCDIIPDTRHEMAWHIGNSGFDMILTAYVSDAIRDGIAAFMKKLLHRQKIKASDISLYAIHPGGTKILQACEEALNIESKQNHYAHDILKNYGNMSSATILFVLKALWDDLKTTDTEKHVFSCAFGPGLTLESMLLKINVE